MVNSQNCRRPRHMSGRGPLAAGNGGKLAFTQALMTMGGTRTKSEVLRINHLNIN